LSFGCGIEVERLKLRAGLLEYSLDAFGVPSHRVGNVRGVFDRSPGSDRWSSSHLVVCDRVKDLLDQ